MKSSIAIGLCGLVLGGLTLTACKPKDAGLPPLPSYAKAQESAWKHAPADAIGGVVVADPSHLLERLRTLRATLASGKVTKTYLDKGADVMKLTLGFDPLDEAAWTSHGLDLQSPIALFLGKDNAVELVVHAIDAKHAQTWLSERSGLLGDSSDCAVEGDVVRCGTTSWKLPADAAHSLWPHVTKNAASPQMEIFTYWPLDQGPSRDELDKAKLPFHALTAGYGGLTIAPERVVFDSTLVGHELTDWLSPFLKPRAGESIIGLFAGATSVGRITFSPDALWASAKREMGADTDRGAGIVQAATGFDVEKDIIANVTGEIAWGGFLGARNGSDGKPRSFNERASYAVVLGTNNDATTRRISDRLGEMMGGAISQFGSFAEAEGAKLAYRADAGDRKVHWVTIDLSAEQQKLVGVSHFDFGLTSVPNGLAILIGAGALDELRQRAGNKPSAMLDRLPHADARTAFATMPVAMWGLVGDAFVSPALEKQLGEIGDLVREITEVAQLFYDAYSYVKLSADRAQLYYQVNFL